MIKVKDGKKVVGSFKNLEEAAMKMVEMGKAVNVSAAKWNISAGINGTEGRKKDSEYHFNGQQRKTAYGLKWYVTKR